MATPKDAILSHLLDHHNGAVQSPARRPDGAGGPVARMSLDQLRRVHTHDHWRYSSSLDHVHWNGADEDRDRGPTQRPAGWCSGLHVRLRRPQPTSGIVTHDHTVDEHGQDRWGWWCDRCEAGDYVTDPDQRDREASAHVSAHIAPAPYEVGWSQRSAPHIIVGYPNGKPATACGKTLAGLAGNYWVEPGDQPPVTFDCAACTASITPDLEVHS